MKPVPKSIIVAFFFTLALSATLTVLNHYFFYLPLLVLAISRGIVLAFIFLYAIRKKTLTTWILFSMLAGAEFGHNFPSIAVNLNLISKIFLNLVKTIIAPLLFGTLVVGIAGHSNLKQVGRMGWPSRH